MQSIFWFRCITKIILDFVLSIYINQLRLKMHFECSWMQSLNQYSRIDCKNSLLIFSEYKSQSRLRNRSVYQKLWAEMIKLKCGNVTRLFLCVYLEIMNIQVDDLELKPFRKNLILLCCIVYAIRKNVHVLICTFLQF